MSIKCFLIEPLLGPELPEVHYERCWPPYNSIIGWRRVDTGDVRKHTHDFGVGAMWFAKWMPKNWTWENETEAHLIVCCPNGDSTRDWDIDSRCSNCGKPEDKLHRCWVRHGISPEITVDKNGLTCSAGAGSILLPKWHGHLRNGELVEC